MEMEALKAKMLADLENRYALNPTHIDDDLRETALAPDEDEVIEVRHCTARQVDEAVANGDIVPAGTAPNLDGRLVVTFADRTDVSIRTPVPAADAAAVDVPDAVIRGRRQ